MYVLSVSEYCRFPLIKVLSMIFNKQNRYKPEVALLIILSCFYLLLWKHKGKKKKKKKILIAHYLGSRIRNINNRYRLEKYTIWSSKSFKLSENLRTFTTKKITTEKRAT